MLVLQSLQLEDYNQYLKATTTKDEHDMTFSSKEYVPAVQRIVQLVEDVKNQRPTLAQHMIRNILRILLIETFMKCNAFWSECPTCAQLIVNLY